MTAFWFDRGQASNERPGCSLSINRVILSQAPASRSIRTINLHNRKARCHQLSAEAGAKRTCAFYVKYWLCPMLKGSRPQVAIALLVCRDPAFGQTAAIGRKCHCNMEVLVGVDANDNVVLLSQSWLCQCCFCHRSLMVVGKSDQHGSRTGL